MTISRLDLDGVGSPAALVTRILQLEPTLAMPVPVEQLCRQFDITSIGELETEGFEAALITDECKSAGAILVATERSRQRRRFSIAHELGHFLACEYYRVDATFPYFVPVPTPIGTMGAFIRIKSPIRSRTDLFDIGVAGPIAGFLVAVPVLFLGLLASTPLTADNTR